MSKVFDVIERFNGFELLHRPTGGTHWLGDGVDVLTDSEENPISPGTPGFTDKWAAAFDSNVAETLEAYFPEVLWNETRMEMIGDIIQQLDDEAKEGGALPSDLKHLYVEFRDEGNEILTDEISVTDALQRLWCEIYAFEEYDLRNAVSAKVVTR